MNKKTIDESPTSLKLNFTIEVPKVYSKRLKELLQTLSKDDLGEYFVRFLTRHTINELNNGKDYLEEYTHKIIQTLVKELSRNNAQIRKDIVEDLLDNEKFYENLLEGE